MLLQIAEYNFTKKMFLLQTFSNKSSETDCQWKITTTYFTKTHTLFLVELFTNSLKFHLSCRLIPVHG